MATHVISGGGRRPGPAPCFDCAVCGHTIGKRRTHWKLADGRVIDSRCLERLDLYDDIDYSGSRAGIAIVLGLWR